MIPKPTSTILEEINAIKEKIELFENIFKTLTPLQSIYNDSINPYARHYHIDNNFIQDHVANNGFKNDGNVGFLFSLDPRQIIEEYINNHLRVNQ